MTEDESFIDDSQTHTGQTKSSTAQNAAIDNTLEEQLNIIAELTMRTGVQNIKDILFSYDPKATKQQIKTTFTSFRKQSIVDTLI